MRLTTAGLAIGMAFAATSAGAQQAAVDGRGLVRVCDINGDYVDSAGDQYGKADDTFVSGPDPGFLDAFSCQGRPQTYRLFTSADPDGQQGMGLRLVTEARLTVNFEPQFTEAEGNAHVSPPQVCVQSQAVQQPAITVLARSRAARSLFNDCKNRHLQDTDVGPCTTVRGRFGGFGVIGFVNDRGEAMAQDEYIDLAYPAGLQRWAKPVKLFGSPGAWYTQGGMTASLISRVAKGASGIAVGELRFYMEGNWSSTALVSCASPDGGANTVGPSPALALPSWMVNAGDAIPDDFTLAISPPTGAITLAQQFDLSVMAATNGALPTGITGSIDGLDVSAPLSACLQFTGLLGGVGGGMFTCRGLSGGFLAGIFGPGAHTLGVSMTLNDGRTISDSVTWTIHP